MIDCQSPRLTSWGKDENIDGHHGTSEIDQGQEEVHKPRMPIDQTGC